MSRTDTLRKQHDIILELATEINQASAEIDTASDAERISRKLGRLDSILKIHLASEDKVLYPTMAKSPDETTARTARRFSDEMGGLLAAYLEFAGRWDDAAKVSAQPGRFRREWQALAAALGKRIARENAELYPLADAMGASA